MKGLLRNLFYVSLPFFLLGLFGGRVYPHVGPINRAKIESALSGAANPELFNFLALGSVCLVSMRVIVFGEVTPSLGQVERWVLYGPVMLAFGCCAPFFSALAGFLWMQPSDPEVTKLAIIGSIGFVWSIGFLLAFILPAHSDFSLISPKTKRVFYKIAFVSYAATSVWFYKLHM